MRAKCVHANTVKTAWQQAVLTVFIAFWTLPFDRLLPFRKHRRPFRKFTPQRPEDVVCLRQKPADRTITSAVWRNDI